MLIDWFTVGAQALNFLILVWLMKRFLYQPILDAIDAREQRIAANLADAAAKEAKAKKERDEFQQKSEEFDQQRASLLTEATAAARAEGQRLLDAAREAADEFSARHMQSIISDARNLHKALTRQTQDEVFAIARKTLTDLAKASLEVHMVDTFIERLRTMPDESRTAFASALGSTSHPALVRSAFDLPATQHKMIEQAINEVFSVNIQVCFQTTPNVICGIELSANGRKIAWSIADYLAAMEKTIDEVLLEPSNPQAIPEAGPGSKTAAFAREETE